MTEEICGFRVSSSAVSRASAELGEMLAQWRTCPLGYTLYVWLDIRYEKVRQNGMVVNGVELVPKGLAKMASGGYSAFPFHSQMPKVHWREFLSSLKKRGLDDQRCSLMPKKSSVYCV